MANEPDLSTNIAPSERDESMSVIVTGRRDVKKFRDNPRYHFMVLVRWTYPAKPDGMPQADTTALIEKADEALEETFRSDPVAVLVAVSTGDGQRDWMFYTTSLHIFQRKLNEALAPLPALPLTFEAVDDPRWEAYDETFSEAGL